MAGHMGKISFVIFLLFFLTMTALSQYETGNTQVQIESKEIQSGKTRIEVIDIASTRKVYSIVLEDVYLQYHPYEFHNGNLYVILRTGGPEGFLKFPDTWTDALWKYDKGHNGSMVYSVRGLDFRVSPNESYIAIESMDSLLILNPYGQRLRGFSVKDFDLEGIDNMCMTNEYLFFSNGGPGASFGQLFKISLNDFSWSQKDLSGLSFADEFSFNPLIETIVGSDYPWLIDTYDLEYWVKGNPTVTLYLYDFRSKKKSELATSIAKRFTPKWLDTTHVEIDDPRSAKRIVIKIK